MASVFKVDYDKPSSTADINNKYAKDGDVPKNVPIIDNANAVQKDARQGNCELNSAQQKLVDKNIDEDTLEYTEEDSEKVGENQIDTTGEDGESLKEKDQKGGAVAASVGASVGAAGAAVMSVITATKSVEAIAKAGSKIPGGMLAAGIVATVGGGIALGCSFEGTFDKNLGERKNQTSNAETNNQTINDYTNTLNEDMEMMVEDVDSYNELSKEQTDAQIDTISEVAGLESEILTYQAQGNTQKVSELKSQIENIKKQSTEDAKGPQEEMDAKKETIEMYSSHCNEAMGVKTSGDTVAEFLKEGDQMENFAKAAQIASYTGAAVMLMGVAFAAMRVGKDLAAIFTAPFAGLDGSGLTLFVAGGVMMGIAAGNFGKRASDEGAAGDAGNEMSGYLATLQENIDAQAGSAEETEGKFLESDEASAETTGNAQEGADKANAEKKQQIAGAQKTETPKTEVPTTEAKKPEPEKEEKVA